MSYIRGPVGVVVLAQNVTDQIQMRRFSCPYDQASRGSGPVHKKSRKTRHLPDSTATDTDSVYRPADVIPGNFLTSTSPAHTIHYVKDFEQAQQQCRPTSHPLQCYCSCLCQQVSMYDIKGAASQMCSPTSIHWPATPTASFQRYVRRKPSYTNKPQCTMHSM